MELARARDIIDRQTQYGTGFARVVDNAILNADGEFLTGKNVGRLSILTEYLLEGGQSADTKRSPLRHAQEYLAEAAAQPREGARALSPASFGRDRNAHLRAVADHMRELIAENPEMQARLDAFNEKVICTEERLTDIFAGNPHLEAMSDKARVPGNSESPGGSGGARIGRLLDARTILDQPTDTSEGLNTVLGEEIARSRRQMIVHLAYAGAPNLNPLRERAVNGRDDAASPAIKATQQHGAQKELLSRAEERFSRDLGSDEGVRAVTRALEDTQSAIPMPIALKQWAKSGELPGIGEVMGVSAKPEKPRVEPVEAVAEAENKISGLFNNLRNKLLHRDRTPA